MSSNELKLFIREEICYKDKFYLLMNLLVQNQAMSNFESLLFYLIYSIQFISLFFSEEVDVLDINNNVSDEILNYIYRVIRIKDLFFNELGYYDFSIICLTLYLIFFTLFFIYMLKKASFNATFNNNYLFLNYMIKINYYFLTSVAIDFFSFRICIDREYNRYIKDLKCNPFDNLLYFFFSFINAIYLIIFTLLMNIFYIESFYLSTSPMAGMSCNIYNIQFFIIVIDSIMLSLINEFHHGIFFLTNIGMSSFLFYTYITKMVYYHSFINNFMGFFYFIYLWESIFFFIFYYITLSEIGLIFILSLILLYSIFYNIKKKFSDKLIKSTPYHKIANKYYLLYYLKIMINLIGTCEHDQEAKSLLIGIIQLHILECPNPDCVTKNKKKLYLPLTNEWSDRSKPFILDSVFLRNFIVVIMSYFVSINFFNPELIINLSYYYLNIIGNICMSIYYYKKVKSMNLTISEYFLLKRLKINISKFLIEKLRIRNEPCFLLEDLNTSLYYEYEYYGNKFIKEIFEDLDLCYEFWSYYLKTNQSESEINFNDVFKTVEKIHEGKIKVKKLWNELFSIYSGVNDLFLFYLDYVGTINDDNLLKRELESIQRKIENSAENIKLNYYNILFKSDTGIVLVNGDKGKEGIILKANNEFGLIFKYNSCKMRGMNITELMPKLFQSEHHKFMRHFYEVGEKKFLDVKGRKIFALDRKNAMMLMDKNVKIFPVLNHNILYIGLLIHEKVDDIILLDSKFNIQGMSQKLFNKFKIVNQNIFNENNIPFYAICKQFINFYKIFLKGNKKKISPLTTTINNTSSQIISDKESFEDYLMNEKEKEKEIIEQEKNENIEINENIELEYEIKIPKFILDYSYFSYHKEKTINIDFNDSISESENDDNEEKSKLLQYKTTAKKTVNFNLVKDPIQKVKKTITKKYNETPGNLQTNNNSNTPNLIIDNNNNNNNTIITPSPDDNNQGENSTFENKLKHYKNLFIFERYNDLENLMNDDTNFPECNIIKFNFTFKKYLYGDNLFAYIIRCIDNKNNIVSSDSDDEKNIQNIEAGNKLLKEKIDGLKKLKEINNEEKEIFFSHIKNFNKISKQNEELNKLYQEYLNDIKSFSRVHGTQQNIIADDENASQTSATGYNSDLSKLSKIQEIKNNLNSGLSNYFSLKYIRLIPILYFGSNILFVLIYLWSIICTFNNLESVNNYNTSIFISELSLIQILNNIIDMRTLFLIKSNNLNYTILTFYTSDKDYLQYCKNKSILMYEEVNIEINSIVRNIHKYLGKNIEKAWFKVPINYPFDNTFQDSEFFIILLGEALINSYSIVQNPFFNLIYTENITNGIESFDILYVSNYYEIIYCSYMSIEESYNNILPIIFSIMDYLIENFIDYSKNTKNKIQFFIILYFFLFVILLVLYYCFIIFTNNHLGEGIEKVVKIPQDKIDDMIKQIITFKSFYKKKLSQLYNLEDEDKKGKINENFKSNTSENDNQNTNQKLKETSSITNDFSFDVKKHKKIKIFKELTYHYLIMIIFLIGFLIPLYLIPRNIINTICLLIYANTYLFENFLYSSIAVFDMKCRINKCNITNDLNFSIILHNEYKSKLFNALSKFPIYEDFYYNGYMKDTCYSLYNENTENYKNCKNNLELTSILNSTDATKTILLKNIEKLLYQLETSLIEDPDFDSYNLLNTNFYSLILQIYNLYYIPVVDKLRIIIKKSINNYIKSRKRILIIINIFFLVYVLMNLIYVNFIFLPILNKRIFISRSFIYIIPSSYISTTQVLENWLEKIDNKK